MAALVIQEEIFTEAENINIGIYEEIFKNWWNLRFFLGHPVPELCLEGFKQCFVEWVREGSRFYLTNHDGYETLKFVKCDHEIYEA
jgi:hypothetical protein